MPGDRVQNPRPSVLIVEDGGLIADRLPKILTKLKYDIVGMVSSGEEAIQRAGEMRPDLVLMDIYLAGEMKGTEAAAQIRAKFDIPVVYLTAYSESSLLEQAKAAGPYGYLVKPVQERELYATIEMALHKHEIEKALRQRNRELALLNQAGHAFNSTLDLDQVLTTVLEEIRHLLDVLASSIWLIDVGTDELVCHQATGLQNQVVRGWRLPPGEGIAGLTVRSGKSVIVPDAQTDEHYHRDVEQQAELTLRSILSVPLRVKESVIGVLQMVDTEIGRFDTKDLALLEPLAASAATAIENARLYEQARQEITERKRVEKALKHRMAQLTALSQASQVVTSSLELDRVLAQVVSLASQVTASDYTSVVLQDEAGYVGKSTQDLSGVPDVEHRVRKKGLTSWIIRSLAPVVIDEIGKDGTIHPDLGQGAPRRANPSIVAANIKSVAGLPLIIKDYVLGVLYLHSLRPNAFRDQLDVLTTFANQAAVAIENARLYEAVQQELVERVRVQRALQLNESRLETLWKLGQMTQASLQQIADFALEGAVKLTGSKIGFVGSLNDDETALEILAWSGGVMEQCAISDEPFHFPVDRAGIWGEAVRHRRPVVVNDYSAPNPGKKGYPEGHVHLSRLVSIPVFDKDRIVAVAAVGNKEEVYDESDIRQITLLMSGVWQFVQRRQVEEERKRLLTQIQEQAQRMRQVMDTVPEGVLLLDDEGQVILVNPVAEEHLLALAGARVGDTLTHLGEQPLAELLTSPPEGLWHAAVTNGRSFQVIARPISGATETGPTPGGWVMVIRDVTQEREIQQRIQQQERLATVGQMAAGIAHDFNNIMATIVLYAQMMSRAPGLSSDHQEQLATINQQALYASDLIGQILDFSRRAMLERQPLNLLLLLKEQVKLLERTVPESIKIRLHYGADEYTVNADPTRMKQIFMNLAVNARDAMPEGGDLRFELERIQVADRKKAPLPEMEAGDWVRVTGSDTGTGIPPDVLPHIYDPFFTTKAPGKGSGLGLSQVHGIVGAHEGYIDVESKVGQGTTFTIYLPALPVRASDTLPLETPALPKGQGETILVVEDNPATRKALVDGLKLLNYQLLTAASGQEALQVIEQRGDEIKLVVSDVVMPDMGGIALLHALREQGHEMGVVLLTGHPLEKELEELYTQGTNADGPSLRLIGWLPKPPRLEQLAEIVARGINE